MLRLLVKLPSDYRDKAIIILNNFKKELGENHPHIPLINRLFAILKGKMAIDKETFESAKLLINCPIKQEILMNAIKEITPYHVLKTDLYRAKL